ncbi:thioredoxin domain-containing protein [Aureimonas altamirensis]|uniref:thioredoxin domain-containing protein n=1 Tax=Aureimonas altamirensis TaxID=370622 RepID=UPI0020369B60|nr:thioredoxin domain-containing protein [Aureimonas altamirensis]MCM2505752.1 thioredoxin domain-containing protein [Aureimonas altamirensis]
MTGNRLNAALSPYLKDHADNPVHWREWTPETLADARAQDKPILLSVGYAACHWCHVMAHESFEDAATADLMNRFFVNVKVDREERPDIDQLYMTALHAMGEQGGWPMTMFLTPDGEPFFGGTYYPPRPAFGRPGFPQLLEAVAAAWRDRRDEIHSSAERLATGLANILGADPAASSSAADVPSLPDAAASVMRMVDTSRGGLTGAPKFPSAPYFELLLHNGWPSGPEDQRQAFITTMRSLCQGGIYDHLGGGIHRYAVDAVWLVPHFEKMLYDNAQFLRHLTYAFRATGDELFRRRARETVEFLYRDMALAGGGLAASLDADSLDRNGHLHEGAYYVFSRDEVIAALGREAAEFCDAYGVGPDGNFEGKTILNRPLHARDQSDPFEEARARLLAYRLQRTPPKRDDKMLADWNGLAIRALATAHAILPEGPALEMARQTLDAVFARMMPDGRLVHACRDGQHSRPALASDYGALITACVTLHAASGDISALERAEHLANALQVHHADGDGGHWLTARDADDVLFPLRGDQDEAIPGATALVIEGLSLLARVSEDPRHHAAVRDAARLAAARAGTGRTLQPGIVAALHGFKEGSELAIFGHEGDDLQALLAVAERVVDPCRLDRGTALPQRFAGVSSMGEAAAMLCRGTACSLPVHAADRLERLLDA